MARDNKMITAVFNDRFDAQRALDDLYAHGYDSSEISVMMSDQTRASFRQEGAEIAKHDAGSKAVEGMGVGGAIGTAVGASLAAIAAIGTTLAIPWTGGASLLVAGPIAAALAGGGAGAVTGGLIGSLVGAGMTEQNAQAYTDALKSGGVVVGVHPHDDNEATRIKQRFGEFNGGNICHC